MSGSISYNWDSIFVFRDKGLKIILSMSSNNNGISAWVSYKILKKTSSSSKLLNVLLRIAIPLQLFCIDSIYNHVLYMICAWSILNAIIIARAIKLFLEGINSEYFRCKEGFLQTNPFPVHASGHPIPSNRQHYYNHYHHYYLLNLCWIRQYLCLTMHFV